MAKKKRSLVDLRIPEKANRILNGILVVLILIAIRIWHLSVVQHEEKIKESRRPQERFLIERSERATINDRFNIPLAINKVQYNAAITYGPIRDLPRTVSRLGANGKREKVPYRLQYISRLANLLGEKLHLDSERIEDLIHSKAAILGNAPCIVKENISEEQYFHLKMLEKDWPGLKSEISAKRHYPLGPIGGEIIGYLGPISKKEYEAVTDEMRELREVLFLWEEGKSDELVRGFDSIEEIARRLDELERTAYSINDQVGKAGIESACDEELRGFRGKSLFLSDIRGNFLKELPGSQPSHSGSKLTLSLSFELQEYAEKLLAEYDSAAKSTRPSAVKQRALIPENQPWIKGGSIVAMDPKSGDIYALASFPRFNPNDFILTGESEEIAQKKTNIHRWLEDEKNIGNLWDRKIPFKKEFFNSFSGEFEEVALEMSWENYLNFILPAKSPVLCVIQQKESLSDAFFIQERMKELMEIFDSSEFDISAAKILDFLYREDDVLTQVMITLQEREFLEKRWVSLREEVERLKEELSPYFESLPLNYEKLLLVDLYRIVVDPEKFPSWLKDFAGSVTLEDFRELSGRCKPVEEALKNILYDLYTETDFKDWRELHFKKYLAKKREEEKKAKKKYARPFIEYLDQKQSELFNEFWEQNRLDLLAVFLTGHSEYNKELAGYHKALKNWAMELNAGAHSKLDWRVDYLKLKKLVDGLDRPLLTSYLETVRSYDQLTRPLFGIYRGLRGNLEKHLASAFYPQYGFGHARSHAFRQATTIGSIFKLVPAYEALKQRYLSLKTDKSKMFDLNPLSIIDDKHFVYGKKGGWNVGFTLEGKIIPMFYKGGRLPRSEHAKVGRVDLTKALETSSNPYFALLASDVLEDPEDLSVAANLLGYGEKTQIELPGEYEGKIPKDVSYNRTGLYAMAIGQHSLVGTPLQTAVMMAALANGGEILKPKILHKKMTEEAEKIIEPEVRWRVFLPSEIQHFLLEGLKQVVMGDKGTARILKSQFPAHLVHLITGKTSTAESIERLSLDGTSGSLKFNHIGFGAICYGDDRHSDPELVVIVYLRFGEWGKDAAPMAAKIFQKWREIMAKHQNSS